MADTSQGKVQTARVLRALDYQVVLQFFVSQRRDAGLLAQVLFLFVKLVISCSYKRRLAWGMRNFIPMLAALVLAGSASLTGSLAKRADPLGFRVFFFLLFWNTPAAGVLFAGSNDSGSRIKDEVSWKSSVALELAPPPPFFLLDSM